MTKGQMAQEALGRATNGQALTNLPAILQGFQAKGIPEDEIKPRENVFTYQAWRALGRQVRKGEHGVRVQTFIPMTHEKKDETTGKIEVVTRRHPRQTTVFHVSQTDTTTQT